MASDIRADMEAQFYKARDEYIAAIRARASALGNAIKTEATDANDEYERATTDLLRKEEAYRRATHNLKSLTSRV